MAKPARRSERRQDSLSRQQIVDVAIELLDEAGEDGLSFRALAARLETGAGAIYWHIANKDDLLVAASNAVVDRAMSDVRVSGKPREAIRKIATAVFAVVDAHPWVGAQLSRVPWDNAMLRIFERIGRQLQALGVPERAQFTAASALVSYVVGLSIQNAMNGRLLEPSVATSRTAVLEAEAARWKALDATEYAFTRNVTAQMREHDDLAEFLAGVDLILSGIAAVR